MKFKQDFKTKTDIMGTLLAFDYQCGIEGLQADFVVLGGSAILMVMSEMGKEFRPTSDVDIEILKTTNLKKLRETLKNFEIEEVGGVMEVPGMDDFEIGSGNVKWLEAPFKNIKVYLPNLEILACCKLFSKRQKDLNDLTATDILKNCNKEKLMSMVEEYKGYVLNLSDPDINVHQLSRILNKKGI